MLNIGIRLKKRPCEFVQKGAAYKVSFLKKNIIKSE